MVQNWSRWSLVSTLSIMVKNKNHVYFVMDQKWTDIQKSNICFSIWFPNKSEGEIMVQNWSRWSSVSILSTLVKIKDHVYFFMDQKMD